jgi:hypothetical protein
LLVVRVLTRFVLLQFHQPDSEAPSVVRDGLLMIAAMLIPVCVCAQLPLAAGFWLSRPAMNRLHHWALRHPGGHLPDQCVGVYWAEEITATRDGVSFRVCGTSDPYGSRSGFFSGRSGPRDGTAGQHWPTADPLWQAWGYDY